MSQRNSLLSAEREPASVARNSVKPAQRVSFVIRSSSDGQEGLQMLIEDLNTQRLTTVTYKLDDIIADSDVQKNDKSVRELRSSVLLNTAK